MKKYKGGPLNRPKIHAQERGLSRYAKELEMYDIRKIQEKIANKDYLFIGPSEKNEERFFAYVEYKNIPYKVLYANYERGPRVITMYPFDVDEYNKLQEERQIEEAVNLLVSKGYVVYKRSK